MKKAIFIAVRTASTRLPGKALIEINGVKTIEYLINRLKASKKADIIVLCTTKLKEDNILCEIAENNKIDYYRGSVKDKLERWNGAAKKYEVDCFVTADGDDLFCEPELIDLALQQFDESNVDFIQANDIIPGGFSYAIRVSALKKVCEIKNSDDTELMWVYFTETNLFNVSELKNVSKFYYRNDIRMTLDYEEDLVFFKSVINLIGHEKYISLENIIEIIDKDASLKKINIFRQNDFLHNQEKKISLDLKINN